MTTQTKMAFNQVPVIESTYGTYDGENFNTPENFARAHEHHIDAVVGDVAFGEALYTLYKKGYRLTNPLLAKLSLEARKAFWMSFEVGDGITLGGYSDANCYTIVSKSKTGKSFVVKQDKTERDPSWNPKVEVGGFTGHVTNNYEQKWLISPNEGSAPHTVRITVKGEVKMVGHCKPFSPGRNPFYDFNF